MSRPSEDQSSTTIENHVRALRLEERVVRVDADDRQHVIGVPQEADPLRCEVDVELLRPCATVADRFL